MPRTTDPVWKFSEKTLKVKNSGKWAKWKKCAKEMQGIPSRLNKHYEECWLEKIPEAESVEDDADDEEVQLTPDVPIPDTLSVPFMSTAIQKTTAMPTSGQKRPHVTHRYAALSAVMDSAIVSTSDA